MTGILAPHGIRVEIELKSKTAVLTEEQRMYGDAMSRYGAVYVLYRCTTDDMKREIDGCVAAVRTAIATRIGAAPLGNLSTREGLPLEAAQREKGKCAPERVTSRSDNQPVSTGKPISSSSNLQTRGEKQ